MPLLNAATEPYASQSHNEQSTITLIAATICLVWYIVVALVCTIGYVQISRHYSRYPKRADRNICPDVTIIRPVKGLEPYLYDCLASTFRQLYPEPYSKHSLHIRFCISSRTDPSLPTLERLLRDFPEYDAQILVEDEDELLHNGTLNLGPNPKIRNMSRAYREARGDIVWIIDCNVWVGPYTCGRMVGTLEGNKFVHLLPIVVDVTDAPPNHRSGHSLWKLGGSRLEELFLSTSHAKFYTAINTVLLAPCIIGKSTMFRISHLNSLTHNQGIDYFSYNICEDHLIGDLLWKGKVPTELGVTGVKLGKHALCFGDVAIQPMSDMSVKDYWKRRVRWLRVRKFTVMLATLVEPGTESFLCSLYGAFAITALPFFSNYLPQTWLAFFAFWLLSVSIWCAMDWRLYRLLQSGSSIHLNHDPPSFAFRWLGIDGMRHNFREWLHAWLGREALAFPIWFWAFWGGTTVEWRGRKFWVGVDMRVHEIKEDAEREEAIENGAAANGMVNGKGKAKGRRD